MASTGDVWKLSGTVGQPDATPPAQLSGNGWSLTGGFWNASLLLRELIFKDGFEN